MAPGVGAPPGAGKAGLPPRKLQEKFACNTLAWLPPVAGVLRATGSGREEGWTVREVAIGDGGERSQRKQLIHLRLNVVCPAGQTERFGAPTVAGAQTN